MSEVDERNARHQVGAISEAEPWNLELLEQTYTGAIDYAGRAKGEQGNGISIEGKLQRSNRCKRAAK
eukprot:3811137-Pleurochrysis_carterae.AAC.1